MSKYKYPVHTRYVLCTVKRTVMYMQKYWPYWRFSCWTWRLPGKIQHLHPLLSLNICSLKLWYIGVVYHNQVLTIYYILFWSKVYWCELLAGSFVNKLYGCPVNYAFFRKMCNTASKGSNVCLCAAEIHEIIYRIMNIFICIFGPK